MRSIRYMTKTIVAIILSLSIILGNIIPTIAKTALPQDYLDFCDALIKGCEERSNKAAVDSREEIIYVMKSCSDIYYREYHEVVSAEQMIKDAAIDKICGGNALAVEAAKGVIESISNGDSAKDTLTAGVNAAINEIPNALQSAVMDAIFSSYISIPLQVLDTATNYVDAKNAKIGYVVAILENEIQVNISKLTVMVIKENLTIEEIEDAYELVTDIYNLMEDITSHVDGVDLPVSDLEVLSAILGAEVMIANTSEELISTYNKYKMIDGDKLQAYRDSYEVFGEQRFEELYKRAMEKASCSSYMNLTSISDDIVIKEIDYAQMFEINGLDNDAIANILSPDKVNDENTMISVLHRYFTRCKVVLNKYNSWIYDYDCALKIEEMMLNSMVELVNNNALYTYASFIYSDYTCNGYILESENFRHIVSKHSSDYYIYRELYCKYIVDTMANLFYQNSQDNKRYIDDLKDWELNVVRAGMYMEAKNCENIDCNDDIKYIVSTYKYTIDFLTNQDIKLEGVTIRSWQGDVEDIGNIEIKALWRENESTRSGGPLKVGCYINGKRVGLIYYSGNNTPICIESEENKSVIRYVKPKCYNNLMVLESVVSEEQSNLPNDYIQIERALRFSDVSNETEYLSRYASVF